MENIAKAIGQRIIDLRKAHNNISQEALAYKAEVDRTYMTGIERGRRNVSVNILNKIVIALDTDLTSFFNHELFKG